MALSKCWVCSGLLVLVLALLARRFLPSGDPEPPPGAQACAGEFGPCIDSGCCSEGLTCFARGPLYAQCRRSCTPGVHPEDPPEHQWPWTCEVLRPGTKPKDHWRVKEASRASSSSSSSSSGGDRSMPVNVGGVSCRDQTPDTPGEPSELAGFPWASNASCSVGAADVAAFDRDGYVVLRQVLEKEPLELLLERAKELCKGQLEARGVCQIEQVRWQVNLFRDFMFYSSLGCLLHAFIRGAGVRVQSEGLFGLQYNKVDPAFFSYTWHTDQPFKGHGVLHGFPTGTKAAAVWFPLHDLDPNVTGGSVGVVKGYPHTDCKYHSCGGMVHPSKNGPNVKDCWQRCLGENGCSLLSGGCHKFSHESGMRIPAFNKGDVVIWHADMPHKTQRVEVPGFNRYSFTIRFVESDAVLCDPAIACGGPMGCCKAIPRVAGQKAHSPCYPQIFPTVLDHEVAAHYSSEPKPLIGNMEHERMVNAIPPTPECAGSP